MNGVNALFDYIRTHAYITKDTRPTPLSKVPERNETPWASSPPTPLRYAARR